MTEYRDFFYHSADGLRLYARDYPCNEAGRSNADGAEPPVLLCMHGLTRNAADFHGFALHCRDRCRVISADQRGRGRSEWDPQVANYTPATYVQDMFLLLDRLGLERVVLVGTSMGGLMAFMMAASQPGRVAAMVINDIGPEVDPRGLERIRSYVGKSGPVQSWEQAVAQQKAINAIAFPDFSETQWQEFTRGLYHEEHGIPVLSYDPAIARPMNDADSGAVPPDLWPLFDASAAIPMLVVRGESSDILAPECVATMRERHPGLQLAIIPKRGHAPMLTEPLAVASIDAFLQGV